MVLVLKKHLMVRFVSVGEDESLNRIPQARYQRILNRAKPKTLYAGRSLRFIQAVVERDEHGDEVHVNCINARWREPRRLGKARTSLKTEL